MAISIPKGTLKRMFKEFHPEVRISDKALDRLVVTVGDFVRMTMTDARRMAEHTGRKTVQEKDIILATT